MDIKIKKEGGVDRKLDIPTFKSSNEINKELDGAPFEEHKVSPKDTVKLEKHEDDLELTTQFITTEFNTDEFETMEVDTIDLENDIESIETEQSFEQKRDEDTIKINRSEYVDLEDGDDQHNIKREFAINIKYLYILIAVIIIIICSVIGYQTYKHLTSESRFLNTALETPYPINDVYVYGESVDLVTSNKIEKVSLYNTETKEYTEQTITSAVDKQLHFSNVENGEYYLFTNNKIITSSEKIDVQYQTITRDDVNKDVQLKTDDQGVLVVTVKDATSKQIDILIDASQGDVQGFTASDGTTTEQELSLKYALALKSNLQSLGYNVALTREDDSVPGDCSYKDYYCDTGRIAMAYKDNPKLYIQLGFNGENGNGFEITDSHLTSHTLARILKSSLASSLDASNRASDQLETGIYNKTYEDSEGNLIDYLYLIRETGGLAMNSDNKEAEAFNTQNVGTEAIEIDLGYMSEETDFSKLNDDNEIDTITKAIASGIDQYVNQF